MLTFDIEQEVGVDAAASSASSSHSARFLQTSLAALSDEYVALQSVMIWKKASAAPRGIIQRSVR